MLTNATNRRVSDLIQDIESDRLIVKPFFQRRLVWKNQDKLHFLDSVIKGYPFPEIYLATGKVDLETGRTVSWLVDGQQRVTTLLQFFKGSDQISYSSFPKYADLTPEEKSSFLAYSVVIRDLGDIGETEIKEVFKRLNSTNYTLKKLEIQNALYNGEFITLGENLSTLSFFQGKNIFTLEDVRRMQDVSFILTIIITLMSDYFSFEQKMADYISNYNEEFDQKDIIESNFINLLSDIDQMNLDEKSRAWNKSDFFTLFVELYKYKYVNGNTINGDVAHSIKDFYQKVDNPDLNNDDKNYEDVIAYREDTRQGANNRNRRVRRGNTLFSILP